jgi:hypothetical protein
MALRKASLESPVVKTGNAGDDPNTLKISPTKKGDLYVSGTSLYFAFGMSGTQWGTAGTV